MNNKFNSKRLLFLLSIIFSLALNAQTQTKDIDVLYQKYKNRDTIEVTNANGTVKLAVSVILNSKGKPESIILTGYADNSTLANSLIDKLENDKKKAGYKYSSFSTVYSGIEILNVSVYTKGSQYAKYGVDTDIFGKNDSPPPYETGTEEQKKRRTKAYWFAQFGGCYVYMEVGDISRKLNDKSEDFKF
ncbi:MAG: hypothetical protein JSR11_03880 [Bacteroidetes bacterium]|nr:hypothetical protein [Bacteroidota bacterium]